jgi:hypothetical protein
MLLQHITFGDNANSSVHSILFPDQTENGLVMNIVHCWNHGSKKRINVSSTTNDQQDTYITIVRFLLMYCLASFSENLWSSSEPPFEIRVSRF